MKFVADIDVKPSDDDTYMLVMFSDGTTTKLKREVFLQAFTPIPEAQPVVQIHRQVMPQPKVTIKGPGTKA